MAETERPPSGTGAPAQRTAPDQIVVRRLEAALVEQARVGDLYALSVGTSTEQSAYVRLQGASAKVTECDRQAKA
jgi:hypothetical protein